MFHVYVFFLIASGIAMLAMAFVRANYAKRRQALNFIFGAGFTVYGLYLLLAFKGGHYVLFYYVFALPVLMVVQFFRDRARARSLQAPANVAGGGYPAAAATRATGPAAGSNQSPGYGQAPESGPSRGRW
jgi:hypothetical protein